MGILFPSRVSEMPNLLSLFEEVYISVYSARKALEDQDNYTVMAPDSLIHGCFAHKGDSG